MPSTAQTAPLAKRVGVGVVAFILNLIAADLGPADLGGVAYRLLRAYLPAMTMVERELLVGIVFAAIIALCVTQFWSTKTAKWVWIVPTTALVVRMFMFAFQHSHGSLMAENPSLWTHFFRPQLSINALNPSAVFDFFVCTMGTVRTGTYSLVAWAAGRWLALPVASPGMAPVPDRPELKTPVLWPRSGWVTATNLLIAVNLAVFVVMTGSGVSMFFPSISQLVHWGAMAGRLVINGESWRLLSAQFVHLGIFHLVTNMACLWWLGRLAERIFGSSLLIALFLLTGTGAGMASTAWNPMRVTAGASGGILGIAGALVAVILYGKLQLPAHERFWRRMRVFLFYLLLSGFSVWVDTVDHVAGFVGGIFLGLMFASRLRIGSSHRVFLPAKLFQARAAIESQAWDAAIDHLQSYLEARPKSTDAHALLGYSFDVLQRFDEAAGQYQQAIELGLSNPAIAANLAAITARKSEAAGA